MGPACRGHAPRAAAAESAARACSMGAITACATGVKKTCACCRTPRRPLQQLSAGVHGDVQHVYMTGEIRLQPIHTCALRTAIIPPTPLAVPASTHQRAVARLDDRGGLREEAAPPHTAPGARLHHHGQEAGPQEAAQLGGHGGRRGSSWIVGVREVFACYVSVGTRACSGAPPWAGDGGAAQLRGISG